MVTTGTFEKIEPVSAPCLPPMKVFESPFTPLSFSSPASSAAIPEWSARAARPLDAITSGAGPVTPCVLPVRSGW
jgi:hypothetical protein